MTFIEKATLAIAAYAAVVATGALFLEVRRWFESKPRLKLQVVPRGAILRGDGTPPQKGILILYVTNRGTTPTTVNTMIIYRMTSIWQRVRGRPAESFVVPNPNLDGLPLNVPFQLDANKMWTGIMKKNSDFIADIENGEYYAGVFVTHRDKAIIKKIPAYKPSLPAGAKSTG
jgi:hypothetical protein